MPSAFCRYVFVVVMPFPSTVLVSIGSVMAARERKQSEETERCSVQRWEEEEEWKEASGNVRKIGSYCGWGHSTTRRRRDAE